eukprot:TRINITY_DN5521_c0_g1_i5.p1 TRINITY_DN5521_c0_g1~~TRINITY_DN5521_c0_g1_i5.p1  ORF type:complete len:115 (-),score=15.25 TRINITY_DN5521_c0_g1_i5:213-557(-)
MLTEKIAEESEPLASTPEAVNFALGLGDGSMQRSHSTSALQKYSGKSGIARLNTKPTAAEQLRHDTFLATPVRRFQRPERQDYWLWSSVPPVAEKSNLGLWCQLWEPDGGRVGA